MSGSRSTVTNCETELPLPPDAWKRAVHRPPPSDFYVDMLPPEKQGRFLYNVSSTRLSYHPIGNSFSYGFRVYPIKGDSSSMATRSTSSAASINPYDVWRKWDDCLFFQDTLEAAYSRAAREKRTRLAAGKGVKKNGVYIHRDQAASWESLPFGPNPNDVARDIHAYIPKLTKKGTLFRPSQEVIDNRYKELRMMMQALLNDDLPTLIKEIKATCTFTDFFGVWRRDIDLARKAESSKKPDNRSRTSLLSSLPLSTSSLSINSLPPAKAIRPERAQTLIGYPIHSDSSSSEDSIDSLRLSRLMDRTQDYSVRSRGSSADSHSSSSMPSTPVSPPRQLPSILRQPVIASQETSMRFGHNPHVFGGERCLESLPEDCELPSSLKSDLDRVRSRKQSGPTTGKTNRNARVYVPSTTDSPQSSEPPALPSSRPLSRRVSLQSTRCSAILRAATYLDELDVDYCLQSPPMEPLHRARASISSLASVMTNSSVDAVIPRSERPMRSNSAQRRPHPEESYELWSEDDEGQDILDTYFHDLIRPHDAPDGFPETPYVDEKMYRFSHAQSSTTVSSYCRYSDRRSSVSSGSTSSSGNATTALSIKAMHEDSVVVLRLPRYTAFDELRRKIYDKFIQADSATICQSFAIALLEQPSADRVVSGRPRADSVSSLGSAYTQGATLHFISSQDEWSDVVATHGGKLYLRIIGSKE